MKLIKEIFDHFLKLIPLLVFPLCFTNFSVDLLAQNGNYYPGSSIPKIPFVSNENNFQQYNFSFPDNINFNTTVFTFRDITIFSYFNNTDIKIYNSGGSLTASKILKADTLFSIPAGFEIYRVTGNQYYTVLVGDAVSHGVSGYYAVDETGRGASTKLNTWMMQQYDSYGDFIIFAYNDNTSFTVKNLSTGNFINAGNLNAGQHFSFASINQVPWSTPLQVIANKPVSALSYTDQDYYVPSSNGTFTGTIFYGFSSYSGNWTNSITVTSYEDNNSVIIKNTNSGVVLDQYTAMKGQVHTFPINNPTYWSLTSTKPVVAANIPYAVWTGSYGFMTRVIDSAGLGAGKLFYFPSIESEVNVFSYYDGNVVKVTRLGLYNEFPYTSPVVLYNGTIGEGGVYTFNTPVGNYVYKVECSKNVSVLQSHIGAGADFVPLGYAPPASVNEFINNVTPPQNDNNVNKSSNIEVVFLQTMNPYTINSSNMKVFGEQTGLMSCAVTYDALQKKATIDPDNNFKAGEKIFVTLTSGIRNLSGINIIPFSYSFSVAATGGNGIFTDRINPYVGYGNTNLIIPGDFDNDGDLDLCVVNTFNGHNNLGILINNNAGIFHIISDYILFNVDIQTVVSGDFDNDGDIDLAVCFSGSLDISIYKNNGYGTFNLASTSPGLGGIFMDQGDFDSDGDIDLVSAKNESIGFGVIRISFNDGSGNFGNPTILASSCSCPVYESFHSFGDLTVSDYDNDGDLDIVVVGAQDDFFIFNCHCLYISLFKNSGSGNFTGVNITPPDYSHFIISDDINGDRYKDLIFSPGHIYKNNNLNFSNMSYPGKGGSILTGDYDGDGDLDIAEQYTDSNNLNIYKNNGTGDFNHHSTKLVSFGAGNAFASGDFDRDGDIDIASSNSEPGTLSILVNNYHMPLFVSPPSPPCGGVIIMEPPYPSTEYFTLEVTDPYPSDIITLDAIQLPFEAMITPSLPITGNPINCNFVLITPHPGIANFKATDQYGNETTCMIYFDYLTPVELTSFTSNVIQRNVKLIWETAAEQNNSGFEIERYKVKLQTSTVKGEESNEWKNIGFVQGHGTTITFTNYLFEDINLSSGKYKYRIKQLDYNGNFHYNELQNEVTIGIPEKFSLSQNYPNPFNPTTKINFDLPYEGIVKIKLFDNSGREVDVILNEFKQAGYYSQEFNAANLSSGVYFYRIEFGKNVMTKKMVLIK